MEASNGAAAADLAREAVGMLADAVTIGSGPRGAGHRQRLRGLLEGAIDRAERACASDAPEVVRRARSTLAKAHAVRAEDAVHGAIQLSLAAQRAPTPEDCEAGWKRVAAIVAVAAESARAAAAAVAAMGDAPSGVAHPAIRRAEAAAYSARRLLDERNHAYTFHTDPGFSFGEGWYLAAASVLTGVAIQIEPGKALARQAETFLRAAGLGDRLMAYRPRPRANKSLTAIVARAFRPDPLDAQRRLRAAFLGDAPVSAKVRDWIDRRLAGAPPGRKVLVWVRDVAHHAGRNSPGAEVVELTRRAHAAGLVPILVGDALRDVAVPGDALDLIQFWKDPVFRGDDARRAQLEFFEHLRGAHGVVGQVGVTTAGMDGPALLGLPTTYLTDAPNARMGMWVGAVPGYCEVVRGPGYLERVSEALRSW
jgi:hypothetical protein